MFAFSLSDYYSSAFQFLPRDIYFFSRSDRHLLFLSLVFLAYFCAQTGSTCIWLSFVVLFFCACLSQFLASHAKFKQHFYFYLVPITVFIFILYCHVVFECFPRLLRILHFLGYNQITEQHVFKELSLVNYLLKFHRQILKWRRKLFFEGIEKVNFKQVLRAALHLKFLILKYHCIASLLTL